MNLEGKLLGNRYEIIEQIGAGGMSIVYKAKCHLLNRFVAIKILKDEFTTDEEFIKRFNIEAQAAASLSHPNIVSIYDVGHEDNLYYIVMELVQGKTLKKVITEEGALSWKWSINVAIQIASALETAHKNNIIHRDIKPHNIIITEDGVAKVTDFGIAKAVSNSTITAFGTTIGSVHYFSPEHAKGGITDAKSDIYSLGVVMYEMLTGKVPFDADTPVSVALKQMQEEPIPPKELNSLIPTALNNIVLKAMQKDKNLRYQSATEMLKDLKMALKNPEGNFVIIGNAIEDCPTQKLDIPYDEMMNSENNDEDNKEKDKKENFFVRHKGLTGFLIVVVLFLVSLGATIGLAKVFKKKDVNLPNVVGMSEQEAKDTIEAAKLVYSKAGEEYNTEVPEGYVISQDPTSQSDTYTVKEKSIVSVIVSKGTETTIMPNVVGENKDKALQLIEDAKLKAEVIEEASKKVEKDIIIRQEITKNKKLNAGETVKIYVSTGIKQVEVPDLLGMTQEQATTTLKNLGLNAKVTTAEDTNKTDGTVIKQDKDVGTKVEEGTNVIITINKIQEIVKIRIKVNLTEEQMASKEDIKIEVKTNDGQTDTKTSKAPHTNQVIFDSIGGIETATLHITVKVGGQIVYNDNFKVADKELVIQ